MEGGAGGRVVARVEHVLEAHPVGFLLILAAVGEGYADLRTRA